MSMFQNSPEAIDNSLVLWPSLKHTNTSVSEVYDLIAYPLNAIEQTEGSTISFNLPPQEMGFLIDVEIECSFKVLEANGNSMVADTQLSIVNNIGAALFSLVEVRLDDRVNLLQQMSQSYAYCHWFETLLNNDESRKSILWARELFAMDGGASKAESEAAEYFTSDTITAIKNAGGAKRANAISLSKKCTVISKLNVPLLRQQKGILPATRIGITFTKNKDHFCLMGATGATQKIHIIDMHLKCTYVKPQVQLFELINSKLQTTPVIYECDKQLLLARLLPTGQQHVTVNNIFEHKIPKFVLFCLQHPEAISGKAHRNPFTTCPLNSLQLFINNRQFFAKALTNETPILLDQLYKAMGRDLKGSLLIDSDNLVLNQIYAICLTDDRTFDTHYNLKRTGDTRLELDLGEAKTENLVLLAYCLYDQQISIDANQVVTIIE